VRIKPVRAIAFTDTQFFYARDSAQYKNKTHRDLIADLFMKVHKCKVENFELLKYEYLEKNGVKVIKISGQLGKALYQT
jgi:hypothetical protein